MFSSPLCLSRVWPSSCYPRFIAYLFVCQSMFATTYLYVPVSLPWSKFLGPPLIQFVFVVHSAVPIGARVTILILKVSITLPSFLASDGEVVAAVEALAPMDPFPKMVVIEFKLEVLTWIFKRISSIEADAWHADHESPMKGVYWHKAKRSWSASKDGSYKYFKVEGDDDAIGLESKAVKWVEEISSASDED